MPIIALTLRDRARGRFHARWTRFGLGLILLAGCGDSGTGSGPPPEVTIVPDQPVSLYVGDTLTVRATIRNARLPGVIYRSSAPEVVQIDIETGLATAMSPGTATISGISQIDPRVFAQTEFTVLPDLPASITSTSLATAAGEEVDLAQVAGTLIAKYHVEAGNAQRFEVDLGGRPVCEQPLSHHAGDPAPPPADIACEIDTAAFDEESGEPWFANGAIALSARLVAAGERSLADAAEVALTLRNPPRLVSRVTGEREAVDSSGEQWLGGDLSVEVIPIVYGSGSVRSVTLVYTSPEGSDTTATSNGAPFSFTLSGEGVLREVTDADMRLSLSSELEGGGDGPTSTSAPVRYDGAPPAPGTLVPRHWVGAQTRFVDTYSTEGEADDGVGRVTVAFYAGDPALASEEIVANGEQVEVGSDLGQSGAGSYRLVAEVCDGLENCELLDGYEFGVDLTPPLIESVSLPTRVANPGADLVIGVRDDLSGFPERMLEVTVQHLDSSPGTDACGPSVEGFDLPGRQAMGGCAPDTLGSSIRIPRTTAGYYSYTVVAFDRAGNTSEPVERSFLIDLEAPTAGQVELSGPVVPGEEFTASIDVADDVDLATVDFRLVYPSPAGGEPIAVPFAPATEVGMPFDETLTRSSTASAALPFVRTLTLGNGGAAPRTTLLVDSLRATAHDAAGLSAASGLALPPSLYGGDVSISDPFPRFSATEISLDRTSVCTAGCGEGDATSMRISARVEGESGTGRPFARIHFYRRNGAGLLTHIGSLEGTDATITNAGNRSSYVYALQHEPADGLTGEFGIVAVGVNSRGGALATSLANAPIVSFYRR